MCNTELGLICGPELRCILIIRSDSRPIFCLIPAISLALTHLSLEASDERVEEVDDGELDEGGEDVDEAQDDEDVEGGGVAHL